jgi:enamine deaminase RidA (YjgF/YER057c/UK114 family)
MTENKGRFFMTITRIEAGPRMSEAVIHGGKVYLCGVVAGDAAGKSVAEQTADILAQIDAMLAEAGSDKTKLLKTNIWLTDISTIGEMNSVWDAWVVAGKTPARATVEAKLALPQWAVEIMVEAAVG